jgi:hypothetical protein
VRKELQSVLLGTLRKDAGLNSRGGIGSHSAGCSTQEGVPNGTVSQLLGTLPCGQRWLMSLAPTNDIADRTTAGGQSKYDADASSVEHWEQGLKPRHMMGYSLSTARRRTRAMLPTKEIAESIASLTFPAGTDLLSRLCSQLSLRRRWHCLMSPKWRFLLAFWS